MEKTFDTIRILIEKEIGFPLTRFSLMSEDDNPEKMQALYPELLPERTWFVQIETRTLEGLKEGIVFVALKDNALLLPHGVRLHLKTFLAANRELAKEGVSPLTLDYIETLEDIVSDTWRFWRDLMYYLDRNHAQLFVQAEFKPRFQNDLTSLYRSLQQVNFLASSSETIDPFPGGVFDLVQRIEEHKE